VGLGDRPLIAGLLDGIVVEGGDLALAHAFGRKPGGNVDVAEPLDVGEDLVGARAGDGAGGFEGVADQDDARPQVAAVDVEIRRPNLDLAGNRERAGDVMEPRQGGVQSFHGRQAKLAKPGIVRGAIDEQVRPHLVADGEQREIGDTIARPFREIGQGRKREGGLVDRENIEADRDRMAGADDLARDAERLAQADVQPVGQHHKARGNRLVIGERDLLPVPGRRNRHRLGKDLFDVGRDFSADGVDQRVVEDADLPAGRLVEQNARPRDPVFARMRGLAQHGLAKAGLVETRDLFVAGELFDTKIGRIDRVGIDQDGRDPRAPEHRCGGRAGEAAADDGDVGVLHGGDHCPRKANKALA